METRAAGVIELALTLMDVHGPGHVYDPVPPPGGSTWLRNDAAMLDLGIARKLLISGTLPTICPADSATPAGLSLLEHAGLQRPSDLIIYESLDSYRAAIDEIARRGTKIVFQHAQPAGVAARAASWIAPELLEFLNNKANLAKLTPEEHGPRREVVPVAELSPAHPAIRDYPVFVKAVTDLSTGGGVAVRSCASPAELAEVSEVFASCENVIVEDSIDFESTFCVQFAVLPDGTSRYLGAAEQICEANRYTGSWLDLRTEPDPEFVEVGAAIIEVAAAMGYRGIAGFDMGRDPSGRVVVFDLNFRINGSTIPLLLAESVAETREAPVLRSSRYVGTGSFEELLHAAHRAIDERWFVPFATRAPDAHSRASRPLLAGLIVGDSRDAVAVRDAELRARI